MIEVTGHVCREIRVHPHVLNFAEFDTLGTFLVVGSSDHGKMFLCDTRTSPSYKLAPAPVRKHGRKQKFKPSFDSPTSGSSAKKEEDAPEVEDVDEASTDPVNDGKYFQVSHWERFEGLLLDLSFVNQTVVALVSTPSDEMGAANESERITCTGDQIAIFSVDKNAKKISTLCVVFLKVRCSGLCLSDNGKFFYTVMQKRKMLAKFKVVEKETGHKLAPLSKTETNQLLDCTSIAKARIKQGLLAVSSRDGHISFHSSSLDGKPDKKLHFFHHDSGGIFHSDVSADGCILAVNEKGCIQLFQVHTYVCSL